MLVVKIIFCFIFGASMRIILRSKWYGPGIVAVITCISAALSGDGAMWIEAIGCSILSLVGSLAGVRLAKLLNIQLPEVEDSTEEDQDNK